MTMRRIHVVVLAVSGLLTLAVSGCTIYRSGGAGLPPESLLDKHISEEDLFRPAQVEPTSCVGYEVVKPDIRLKANEIDTFFTDKQANRQVRESIDQILSSVPDQNAELRNNIEILIYKKRFALCEVAWLYKICRYYTNCYIVDAGHRVLGEFGLPDDLDAFRLGTLQH